MAKKRILIVDDNPDIIRILETLLTEKYEVLTAADGMAGLEKAFKYQPDLAIIDIMMPKMSGYQLVESMKKHPQMQSIPIIFLTAKGTPVEKEFGLKKGATIYMTKPFDHIELQQTIEILLKFGATEKKTRPDIEKVISEESTKKDVEWK
ncbi:MAG: response regulator [bacterium]|nr:response regulator [bacterium]